MTASCQPFWEINKKGKERRLEDKNKRRTKGKKTKELKIGRSERTCKKKKKKKERRKEAE